MWRTKAGGLDRAPISLLQMIPRSGWPCDVSWASVSVQYKRTLPTQHRFPKKEKNPRCRSRGHHCGDIELAGYVANAAGPVPLVLDLRIAHDRFGSSSNPDLNGKLHWPNDMDKSLNETVADKIRKYRSDYNNNPNTISFIPTIPSTSGRLHSEFIRILFLQVHQGNWPLFCSFRSSVSAIKYGSILPLSSHGFLFDV